MACLHKPQMHIVTQFPPGIVSIQLHGSFKDYRRHRRTPRTRQMSDKSQPGAAEDMATFNASWLQTHAAVLTS